MIDQGAASGILRGSKGCSIGLRNLHVHRCLLTPSQGIHGVQNNSLMRSKLRPTTGNLLFHTVEVAKVWCADSLHGPLLCFLDQMKCAF